MTKQDLVAQLAKLGMNVDADKFDIPKLKKMIALMQEDDDVPVAPPKKQKKVKAKRPDNVRDIAAPEPVVVVPAVPQPGTYIVSFNLQMHVKERGYTTKMISEEYTADGIETEKEIAKELAEKYITTNDQHLHSYSDNEVEIMGITKIRFTEKKDIAIRDVKARQAGGDGHARRYPLQYKLFPDDLQINKNEGQCVLDMIMVAANKAWPMFTRPRLIEELTQVAEEQDKNFLTEGVSTRQIMAWAKMKKRVTCIALTPFLSMFESVVAQDRTELSLVFIVNNSHVYPITDPDMKLHIAKTGKVDYKVMQVNQGSEDWHHSTVEDALSATNGQTKLIHVETDDLSHVLKEVVVTTGYNPVGIMSNGPIVTAFEHPVTHQVFIASPDFLQRKEVCEQSLKETNYIGFIWKNQSWAELWKAWVDCSVGELPLSSYSQDSLMIRERYPMSAYVGMTREVTEDEKARLISYDIHKCYTSCNLENTDDFAIESVFDDIEPWVNKDDLLPVGKAYIARPFSLGSAKYPRGFYPSFFVEYVLDEEAIDFEDITHIQRAARKIKADTFKNLTEKLMKMFPTHAKRLVNNGIGAWGKRFHKQGSIAITDSFEIALGMATEDKDVRLSEVGNSFWFLRKEKKELLYSGHIALREHIVCMGHIKLHKMEKAIMLGGGEIIAYNTDSIKVLGGNFDIVAKQPGFAALKEEAKPGDFCLEGKCNLRGQIEMKDRPAYKHTELVWNDVNPAEAPMGGTGMMVTGQPGFGKSYLLKQADKSDKANELKTEKMTWTKTAALNIDGETLDHVFPQKGTRAEWIAKGMTYDVFSFDEFTIIPEKWWPFFMQLKTLKPSLRFRFFGDPQQLHSQDYDSGSDMWFRYDQTRLMHFLVDGHRLQLSYLPATARYDADMKTKLDSFEATRMLAAFGKKRLFTPAECDFNIVKSDAKRTKVNDEWVAHYSAGKKTVKCGKLRLWEGMYLISHGNSHGDSRGRSKIVNSTRYLVKKIGEEITLEQQNAGILPKEFQVTFKEVAATCRYGYADTVMRVISRTIPGRFNIYEDDCMDWNEMFVALSRARSADAIGIDYEADHVYRMATPPPRGRLVKLKPE